MNNYFDKFQVAENKGCNCETCKRQRYEEDLVGRIKPNLPPKLTAELQKYLEWYFDALVHAGMEVEALNHEKTAWRNVESQQQQCPSNETPPAEEWETTTLRFEGMQRVPSNKIPPATRSESTVRRFEGMEREESTEEPYTCEYEYDGSRWGITIYASSWAEAERKLRCVSKGKVLGVVKMTIPVPGGMQILRLVNWFLGRER